MTDDQLDALRPSAFAIAYRMLGSVGDAEDVVQEGLLRLHRARAAGERIDSPRAYLSTVVSRLAIDQLRSARTRRETYVGEWLPEPLVASEDDDPARRAEMADSLSLAFLVLLESLSPEQRAAFLRREQINGQPGARLLDREGRLVTVMILDVADGRIQGVSSIVNPDKLRHLGPLADVNALLRGAR
jgi:RNA polymerase sigma factor (sigma-70 family)